MSREISQEELAVRRILMWVVIGVVCLFGVITVFSSFYTVESGHRALVFTWREITAIEESGLHFKIPFAQSIQEVDIRARKVEAAASAVSKDIQEVETRVSVNYSYMPNKLKELYSEVGLNAEEIVISGRIQDVIKAVTPRYTVEELVLQREKVRDEIMDILKAQLSEFYIQLPPGAVQITNFNFSKAYADAIEEKQVMEQKALTAQNTLAVKQAEATARIAQATGEAEAIKVQAEAIRLQGGKDYVTLKAIEKWDGKLPMYSGSNGPLPFIEVK